MKHQITGDSLDPVFWNGQVQGRPNSEFFHQIEKEACQTSRDPSGWNLGPNNRRCCQERNISVAFPHSIFFSNPDSPFTKSFFTLQLMSSTSHGTHGERPERSRNAKAQARHRAKRKAYIEQVRNSFFVLVND